MMAKTEFARYTDASMPPRDICAAVRDEMDRVFERFEAEWPRWPRAYRRPNGTNGSNGTSAYMLVPNLDVRESGRVLVIEAELPGVEERDVSVTLSNGLLTIRGEKKDQREEHDETHYRCERDYGTFERCLRLPDTIDESKV